MPRDAQGDPRFERTHEVVYTGEGMTDDVQQHDTRAELGSVSKAASEQGGPPRPFRSGPRPQRRALVPLWVYGIVAALVALGAIGVGATFAVNRSVTREVPDVTGLDSDVARTRIRTAGFEFQAGDRRFSVEPRGTVLEQDPEPGVQARRGSTVSVVVSAGTEEFTLPDIIGNGIVLGRGILEERGLEVKVNTEASDQPRDTVLSTNPSAGSIVHTGDIVIVTVAAPDSLNGEIVPYLFDLTQFVIDPSKPASGTDVPLEVSRRLRSLLEASGASVLVTRGLSDEDVSIQVRAKRAKESSATAIVGIDVSVAGDGGFALAIPSGIGTDRETSTRRLAEALYNALTLQDSAPHTATVASDPLVRSTKAPVVRVSVGALGDRDDAASFRDPAWADQVARTLYRALGETYGSPQD